MYRNILVPLDQSKTAENAVETAITLAKAFDGKITLIHVMEILPLLPKAKEIEYKTLKTEADQYLTQVRRKIAKSEIPTQAVIKTGDPSLVVCKYAKEHNVDVIILSGSGQDEFDRWALGSVSDKILNHSPSHVLLVKSVSEDLLRGRTILVVDDEPDILETIEEELSMCVVHKALDSGTASEYLRNNRYDIVILDIMGVDGFELLKQTVSKGIPTVMLTAHALTSEALTKAAKLGAASFLPKEKMMELQSYLGDVIERSGKPAWKKLFDRLAPYFRRRFGWTPEEEKETVTMLEDIEAMDKKA